MNYKSCPETIEGVVGLISFGRSGRMPRPTCPELSQSNGKPKDSPTSSSGIRKADLPVQSTQTGNLWSRMGLKFISSTNTYHIEFSAKTTDYRRIFLAFILNR